jgi:hypothetical protein
VHLLHKITIDSMPHLYLDDRPLTQPRPPIGLRLFGKRLSEEYTLLFQHDRQSQPNLSGSMSPYKEKNQNGGIVTS